jgi:hypothetical protein
MKYALVALLSSLAARGALAQGEISGRVVAADSGRQPLAGVEANMPRLKLSVLTDSSGRFRLKDIPAGTYLLIMRRGWVPP